VGSGIGDQGSGIEDWWSFDLRRSSSRTFGSTHRFDCAKNSRHEFVPRTVFRSCLFKKLNSRHPVAIVERRVMEGVRRGNHVHVVFVTLEQEFVPR
jgi:hypothetical protein